MSRGARTVRAARVAASTGAVLFLSLSGTSCAGEQLKGQVMGTQTTLQRAIRDGSKAIGCAPKDTALAEANIKFAEDALVMGEMFRGREHAQLADLYTKLAVAKTDPVRCREPGFVARPAGNIADDRDQDGYDDDVDTCPDDPEDFDGFEDEDGCPDTDNDKDGVLDASTFENGQWVSLDRKGDLDCRNDPEDMDGFEDEDGCPDLAAKWDGCELKLDDKIYFQFNKYEIDPKSYDLLGDVALALNEGGNKAVTIEIGGHTDSKGSGKYNQKLSQQRVEAVRTYLINKGIDPSRMTAVGYGEDMPIDTNRTAEGRANNRRVEFVRTDSECKK
ncbi:MAG: OmpA family protein [Nannocystaceae bacterium]